MLPTDIKNLILSFSTQVSYRTLCLTAIKFIERTKYVRIHPNFSPRSMYTNYKDFTMTRCLIREANYFADILKKIDKYIRLPNNSQQIFRNIHVIRRIPFYRVMTSIRGCYTNSGKFLIAELNSE